MTSSRIYIWLCLGIVVIQCMKVTSSSEPEINYEHKCDALIKKALEPIYDKETKETVYKLTMNYIEFAKKTHEQVYKATQAEGQKEIFDKFVKYTEKWRDELVKDVRKIIESSPVLKSFEARVEGIILGTAISLRKLESSLPKEYSEFKSKYLIPIETAIAKCHREICRDIHENN